MSYQCPHCATALDLENLPSSEEGVLQCPECGGDLPDADSLPPAPEQAAAPHLSLWRSVNRRFLILGAAALLVLGAIVFFIASRESGDQRIVERNITNKKEYNEYFQKLIREGKTTEADLEAIARIESFGATFVGITKDTLSWKDAEAVAKRAGGGILDLSQLGTSRRAIINWLVRAHPDSLGKTTWILDGAEPLGIDSPDFGPVSTLDRPRRAFVYWPGNMPTGWEWSVEPRFDEALPFEGEVARVRVGEKWGLVDKQGKDVLVPTYEAIAAFSEFGGARVTAGGQFGLVDRTGKVLAKPEWEDVQDLINGFLAVKREGKWGYLDAQGSLAIPCQWDDAWRFSAEGFAVVTRDNKRGIIDRTGRIIVAIEWDGALNFCKEGIGALRRGDGWALVNSSGNLLTDPVWQVWLPNDRLGWDDRRPDLGWIPVRGADGFTLLGLDGRPVVAGAYKDYYPVKAGAILSGSDGVNLLIGKDGRELMRFRGSVFPAREGLLRVENDDEFGFLGDDGTWKLPMGPGEARSFTGGLAAFSRDGKWGFLGPNGQTVVAPQWDEVRDFREDCAAVRRGDRWGFVNRQGEVIASPKWTRVGDFSCGRAAVFSTPDIPGGEPAYVALERRSRQGDAAAREQIRNMSQRERVEMSRQLQQHARALNQGTWGFLDASGRVVFEVPSYSIYGMPEFRDGRLRRFGHPNLDIDGRPINPTTPIPAIGPEGLVLRRVERESGLHDRHGNPAARFDLYNSLGGLVLTGANPRTNFDDLLIPHAGPAKFGLMDANGRVLAEPRWDDVRILSPEWVWVELAGKSGILAADGRVVLEPEWDEVRVISPDWLWLRRGEKCGLADASGRIVVPPEWEEAEVLAIRSESSNTASAAARARNGGTAISPWLRVRSGERSMILLADGRPALPETLRQAQVVDFYGPRQLVIVEDVGENRLWSLYDPAKDAKITFPDARSLAWNWRGALDGLIWVRDKNDDSWKLMRETGEPTGLTFAERPASWNLRPGKSEAGGETSISRRPAVENRSAFEQDGKWGFTDGAGAIICPAKWDEVRDFSFGRAAVRAGAYWGFVDEAGTTVIEPVWDEVRDFGWPWRWEEGQEGAEEHAFVRIHSAWALVDRGGALIVDPKYNLARPYRAGGVIELARKGDWQFDLVRRDPGGKWTVTPRNWPRFDVIPISPDRGWAYEASKPGARNWALVDESRKALTAYEWGYPGNSPVLDVYSQGLILARRSDGKTGLINANGGLVWEPVFDRITWVAPGRAAVWSSTGGGIIDAEGKWHFRDGDQTRVARFTRTTGSSSQNNFRHGLVVLEDQPKWGYAKLISIPKTADIE